MAEDNDARKQARRRARRTGGAKVRVQAKEAASAAGRDWTKLSKDERRPFVKEARKAGRKTAVRAAIAEGARKAAEQAGQKWSEMSKEQKQALRRQVVSAKREERQARRAEKN